MLRTEQKKVLYKVKFLNCNKCHVSQTGRKVPNWMLDRKPGTRRHDPLPVKAVQEYQIGHMFNRDEVRILGQTTKSKQQNF